MPAVNMGIVTGPDPVIDKQLQRIQDRKHSKLRSYKQLKTGYKGKISANKKPFSRFILFSFEDGSSEFVIDEDAKEFCEAIPIKNHEKFLDYVQNYYNASITVT